MARLLLSVENMQIIGDGDLAIVPGITFQPHEGFRAGDPIRLKRPDGSAIEWQIGALTVLSSRRGQNDVCLVLKGLREEDVPIGTEIWSVRSQIEKHEAQPTCKLPNRVRVRVNHPQAEGLMIALRFGMTRKNDHFYTVFLGPGGRAEVSSEELLRKFDQNCAMFIMDYDDPRGGFNGRVTPKVYSTDELRAALKAVEENKRLVSKARLTATLHCNLKGFRQLREYYSLPAGHEDKLKAAAARGQDPDEYHVEVELG